MSDTIDSCWDAFAKNGKIESYLKYRELLNETAAEEPAAEEQTFKG